MSYAMNKTDPMGLTDVTTTNNNTCPTDMGYKHIVNRLMEQEWARQDQTEQAQEFRIQLERLSLEPRPLLPGRFAPPDPVGDGNTMESKPSQWLVPVRTTNDDLHDNDRPDVHDAREQWKRMTTTTTTTTSVEERLAALEIHRQADRTTIQRLFKQLSTECVRRHNLVFDLCERAYNQAGLTTPDECMNFHGDHLDAYGKEIPNRLDLYMESACCHDRTKNKLVDRSNWSLARPAPLSKETLDRVRNRRFLPVKAPPSAAETKVTTTTLPSATFDTGSLDTRASTVASMPLDTRVSTMSMSSMSHGGVPGTVGMSTTMSMPSMAHGGVPGTVGMNTVSAASGAGFSSTSLPRDGMSRFESGDDPTPIVLDEYSWHTPKIELEFPPPERFTRVHLETSCMKPKLLYGLFVKLRPVSTIRETVATAPGAIPIIEPLDERWRDMTKKNKVLLLEWQTNRAKKLNGVQRFRFEGVPVMGEGDTPLPGIFFLEEKEPIRTIVDKQPIRLMQYETSFGPTRKRLLKVSHVTLDNRRKYHIVCPSDHWPVYEIWEMIGPRPIEDRHVLVYRSPESPVLVTGPMTGMQSTLDYATTPWVDDAADIDTDTGPTTTQGGVSVPFLCLPTRRGSLDSAPAKFQGFDYNDAILHPHAERFARFWKSTAAIQFTPSLTEMIISHWCRFAPSLATLNIEYIFTTPVGTHDANGKHAAQEAIGWAVMDSLASYPELLPAWCMYMIQPCPFREVYARFTSRYCKSWARPISTTLQKEHTYDAVAYAGATHSVVGHGVTPEDAQEQAAWTALRTLEHQFPDKVLTRVPSIVRPAHAKTDAFAPVDPLPILQEYVQLHSSLFDTFPVVFNKEQVRVELLFRNGQPLVTGDTLNEVWKKTWDAIETLLTSSIQSFMRPTPSLVDALPKGPPAELATTSTTITTTWGTSPSAPSTSSATTASLQTATKPTATTPNTSSVARPTATYSQAVTKPTATSSQAATKSATTASGVVASSMLRPQSAPFVPLAGSGGSMLSLSSSGHSPPRSTSTSLMSRGSLVLSGAPSTGNGSVLSDATTTGNGSVLSGATTTGNGSGQSSSMSTVTTSTTGTYVIPPLPEMKLPTCEAANQLFEILGISPVRSVRKADLNIIRMTCFNRPIDETIDWGTHPTRMTWFLSPVSHTITCPTTGGESQNDKKIRMREQMKKEFLPLLNADETILKNDLCTRVPPDTDGSPTSTLLQFIQMHSIYKNGDELQGMYKAYMQQSPITTATSAPSMPLFECQLTFRATYIGLGKGDTKRRAREQASRVVLRRLADALSVLDTESRTRLQKKYTTE